MAFIVDQQQKQPQHKHYCRICKKGFGCIRALGSHMRAHGINNEIFNMNDDDEDHISYGWDASASKRMYSSLRTNPNRFKTCRVCDNCGMGFSSWKSFLEHGKCILDETDSDAGESFLESDLEEGLPVGNSKHNWSKRKRSYRAKVGSIINPNCLSSEEEDLAHCLMMLSNGIVEHFSVAETEDSCASARESKGIRHNLNSYNQSYKSPTQYEKENIVAPKGLFECKACKKVFNSHQALGGHRASHKKVKGCFAAKFDHTDDSQADQVYGMIKQKKLYHSKIQYDHNGSFVKKKTKVHECSICYRVFSSGQALGGHKRCHWITSKNSPHHASCSVDKFDNNQFYNQAGVAMNNFPKNSETLDLTLDLKFHVMDAKQKNNQISQEIFLLPWVGGEDRKKDEIYATKKNIEKLMDDEANTNTKFSKLIELNEINSSETSSQWLRVGIGSTSSQVGNDP